MRYAHNVARGYDDRAATTRALMCLPAGMMELVRPESMRPQTSQRSVLGADTSAATRGVGNWIQDGGETTSKTPQPLRGRSVAVGTEGVLLERSWAGNPAIARARDGGRFDILPKRRCSFRSSVYRRCSAFSNRSLWFVQRSGTQGDTVRTQHVETTARLASKTAARRIKADIRGSALPITRNEETQ